MEAVGTISSASNTSLTVGFTTRPTTAGLLSAQITTNSAASASTVVASVAPVVTANAAAKLAANALHGADRWSRFRYDAGNNTVVFDSGAAGNGCQCNIQHSDSDAQLDASFGQFAGHRHDQ